MKKFVLFSLTLLCVACIGGKYPLPEEEKRPGNEQIDPDPDPDPKPDPDPDPPGTEEPGEFPAPEAVTLCGAFAENFSARESAIFDFQYRSGADDFRYYSGYPSLSERNQQVLMLRLDPQVPAGVEEGAVLSTPEATFYGSYAFRLRIPSIRRAQPKVTAHAAVRVLGTDAHYGDSEVAFQWTLSDPTQLQMRTNAGIEANIPKNSFTANGLSGFDASARLYSYGFDWHADRIDWWMQSTAGGEKTTLWTLSEDVPMIPGRFRIEYWHEAAVPPLYPFEMEVDDVSYTPFQDEIDAWTQKYFK